MVDISIKLPDRHAPAVATLLDRHRFRGTELIPWAAVGLGFVVFPDYLVLGAQMLAMILFALSLDLIVGYAGIVTLGHAAFFGIGGYAAGLIAIAGWGEPVTGLLAAALAAAAGGWLVGLLILRHHGLSLLMLTLAAGYMLHEAANRLTWLTGGADGLQGMVIEPLFGQFEFDLYGQTAYLYAAAVLFAGWGLLRILVHSPFGCTLVGIRDNPERMRAIGSPVFHHKLVAFTIAAGLAGAAGALMAQTSQFVSLNSLGFELSGQVLVMLILGGRARLYGAFCGVPFFMVAQDRLAQSDPTYWLFWVGLLLVIVVLFAPQGLLGLIERAGRLLAWKKA